MSHLSRTEEKKNSHKVFLWQQQQQQHKMKSDEAASIQHSCSRRRSENETLNVALARSFLINKAAAERRGVFCCRVRSHPRLRPARRLRLRTGSTSEPRRAAPQHPPNISPLFTTTTSWGEPAHLSYLSTFLFHFVNVSDGLLCFGCFPGTRDGASQGAIPLMNKQEAL